MTNMNVEGRRIYIKTRFGSPLDLQLKSLGATWDKARRSLWIGVQKRAKVEALLAVEPSPADQEAARLAALERDHQHLIGSAKYKGQSYYLVAKGDNDRGPWFKLLFRDGSRSFFATSPSDVEVVKIYQKPRTLAQMQEFAEKLKTENDESLPFVEHCDECGASYRTYGNVSSTGMECRRCG